MVEVESYIPASHRLLQLGINMYHFPKAAGALLQVKKLEIGRR